MEHILQTLIDNSSFRRGLLFHMENLQPEKQLLSSLEAPLEVINKLIEKLEVLHKKDNDSVTGDRENWICYRYIWSILFCFSGR